MQDQLLMLMTQGDTVLFWVLAAVGGLLARFILGQIGSETARKYVGRALDEIGDAVREVGKTYVESIKQASADGKLTAEEKAEAKRLALATAKRNIGPDGLKRLAKILGFDMGALDNWLITKIEAALPQGPVLKSTTLSVGEASKTTTTVGPQ